MERISVDPLDPDVGDGHRVRALASNRGLPPARCKTCEMNGFPDIEYCIRMSSNMRGHGRYQRRHWRLHAVDRAAHELREAAQRIADRIGELAVDAAWRPPLRAPRGCPGAAPRQRAAVTRARGSRPVAENAAPAAIDRRRKGPRHHGSKHTGSARCRSPDDDTRLPHFGEQARSNAVGDTA
ncbi:MAG: hypothetical protein OXI57_06905 [Rhodospirillales bacterium]|nr:hypothetical protein [Rhodospirillales bacterium]